MHLITLQKTWREPQTQAPSRNKKDQAQSDVVGAKRTINKIHPMKIQFFIIKVNTIATP